MATTIPSSTPSATTPSVATSDSKNDDGRTFQYLRSAATFVSDSAAAMTTPASADCGRSASSELRKSSSTATRPAPTTPVSWDFAPDCSATAVRELLVEMAKPWKKPAAMFAAPMPIISWLGWSSSPRRAANADAVAMVSVSETEHDADGGEEQGPDVAERRPRE